MFDNLPKDIHEFMGWEWDQIHPFTEDLETRELNADSLHQWLLDWAAISNLINETFNRLEIRTTTHTDDGDNQARFNQYGEAIMPKFRTFENNMKQRLLDSGLEPEHFAVPLRKLLSEADLFRETNLPILTEIEKLGTEFSKIVGARTVNWDGEDLTPTQLYAKLTESDRAIRERAWRALSARAQEDREAIDGIWVKLLDLRHQLASNAGFEDYRSYRWKELGRFDYGPEDCKSFHRVIEDHVVPAARRMSERRKKRLSLDTLRVWDDFWFYRPDCSDEPPLRPFETIEALNDGIERMFSKVDPAFGNYYRIMRQEGLLDLESRVHKTSGAYMHDLPFSARPFIFANAVGMHSDVETQLHEGGHAFHFFEASHWPYQQQSSMNYMPVEFVEVGSMALELLAAPYFEVEHGGFYTKEEAARARINQLESNLGFWPYMAVVDAFQHWVYENPEEARDTTRCDDMWESLHRRFLPQLDWTGIEDTLRFFWRQQGHIINSPFYYVEYGMALLGATQIWANALDDQATAVAAYRKALQLGATATLPKLFEAAGVKFSFDESVMPKMVELIEKSINELESG